MGQPKKSWKSRKSTWVIVGVLVLIVAIIGAATGGGSDDADTSAAAVDTTAATTATVETTGTEASSTTTTEEETTTTTEAREGIYDEGTYLVGEDIPEGLYRGLVKGSGSIYWEVASDATGTLGSIVANGNSVGPFYVLTEDGQYLTIRGGQVALASDMASTAPVTTVSDGTYLVGTDIPAGRYKGMTTGGSGYWQVSSDATGKLLSIIANANTKGQFYVEVKDGQFLQLDRAEISLVE